METSYHKGDRIMRGTGGAARTYNVLVAGHHDSKLSPRGRLIWRLILFLVVAGGITLIWMSR